MAPGSILGHLCEHFGSFFGPKNGPRATSERFFGEKRDSEQTLVITIYLKDFTGPERTKKRLGAGFWGSKTERKTERRKRQQKTAFGSDFGSILEAKTAKHGSKNGSEHGSKKRAEKGAFGAAGGSPARTALLKQKADLYGFWWYGFGTAKVGSTRPAPARGAGGLSIAKRHRRPVVFGFWRFVTDNF